MSQEAWQALRLTEELPMVPNGIPVASASAPSTPMTSASALRSYDNQFTPATEALLKRMRACRGDLSLAVAGTQAAGLANVSQEKYEDARRRLIQSLKTSDTVQLPPINQGSKTGSGGGGGGGASSTAKKDVFKFYNKSIAASPSQNGNGGASGMNKKKRATIDIDGDSPYSDADAEAAGSQVKKLTLKQPVRRKRPKVEGTKRCGRCDRQAFTQSNHFITCPACDEDWHIGCLPPNRIRSWRNDPARFRCLGCLEFAKEYDAFNKQKSEALRRQKEQEFIRQKQRALASLPVGVSFEKVDMIGFGGGVSAPDNLRTDYFAALSRKDQLSLLSFCDKLHPGLLASLLGAVSKKHPDLPIFNSPDWAVQVASRPQPKRALRIEVNGPRMPRASLPARLPNGISAGSSSPLGNLAGPSCLRKPEMNDPFKNGPEDADVPVDDDDLLPPTWPKDADGEGFYHELIAERRDAGHLVDANDDKAHPGYEATSQDAQGNICYDRVSCAH